MTKDASSLAMYTTAAAIALVATGLLTLTIQFLMAPTHTIRGVNYADVWHGALTIIGGGLILMGGLSAFLPRFSNTPVRKPLVEET